MKLYFLVALMIICSAVHATDDKLKDYGHNHAGLQEEIKNKKLLIKEIEQKSEFKYVTSQTKEYLKELEVLESEKNDSTFEKNKSSIEQRHNVFAEMYYQ